MTNRQLGWVALVSGCLAFACAGGPGAGPSDEAARPAADESVGVLEQGLDVASYYDDSISGIHVQIKVCRSDTTARRPYVYCNLDSGYTVTGGGAYANYTGAGAFLTENWPPSDLTWTVSSRDLTTIDTHYVYAYAVGIHLDGVNAARLATLIDTQEDSTSWAQAATPSLTLTDKPRLFGGGASTNTSGLNMVITQTSSNTTGSWTTKALEHLVSPAAFGSLTMYRRYYNGTGVIEAFGALDIQEKEAGAVTVTSGVATANATVSTGWALAGYGGKSTWTNGPGRMLYRIGKGSGLRDIIVASKDYTQASSGTTTAAWTQIRKTSGSHSLCNTGAKLASGLDSCTTSICSSPSRSYCCTANWDAACVGYVQSVCGRSCTTTGEPGTCSTPTYQPDWYDFPSHPELCQDYTPSSDGTCYYFPPRDDNVCYAYATNTWSPDFHVAIPGRSSTGSACGSSSCYTVAEISRLAVADGLIKLPAGQTTCPGNLSKIALAVQTGVGFHWYRQDGGPNGNWSQKDGYDVPTNLDIQDSFTPHHAITNPEQVYRITNMGWTFGGYFCTCSSSTEGKGHAEINHVYF